MAEQRISTMDELADINAGDYIEVSEDNGAGGYNTKKYDLEDISTLKDTTVPAKADKVTSATAGNLAELDASGNLVDSGIAADDVNPAVFDIELDVTAGLFDFSVTGVTEFSWYFPEDGTTSTASRPAKTLTEAQTVVLSAKWGDEAELANNETNEKYVGDLSDVSNVSYYLSLVNCSNITGDLSDVSNVSYYLRLVNCSNITGDLSDVSNVSYYLRLFNCSNITGDLSDVSNVSYYLRLFNCSNITGDLSDVSNVSYYLNLYDCSNVTGSLSSACTATYINLTNIGCSSAELDTTIANLVTANQSDGTLILTGLTRTSASSADVATLESRGWTVTDATIV
jgi:glucan-binding YG repeat protein